MISIIICSINLTYFEKLKTNISETIGLKDYEIIKIDNLKNKWSITHAYNFGYKKAKFNNLLFIHEDILFCNNNWGQIFIQELNEKNIGLLGVAGASYKSIYPSAFWHVPKELLKVNIIQNYKNKTKEIISQGFSTNNNIKAIDGVFLGIKKSLDISFNQKIKGFHCYDLGISLDVLDKGLKLKVSEKILIEHFSIGTTNKTFLKNYISFHKIYKQKIKKNITYNKKLEIYARNSFLYLCLENSFFSFNLLVKSFILNPMSKINISFLKMGIIKLIKKK